MGHLETVELVAQAVHAAAHRLAPEFGVPPLDPSGGAWTAAPPEYRWWLRAVTAVLVDAGLVVTPAVAGVLEAALAFRLRRGMVGATRLDEALAAWDAALLAPSATCAVRQARDQELIGA